MHRHTGHRLFCMARGGEIKRAYKLAGASGGAVFPILATIVLTSERSGVSLESAPAIAFAMVFCAAVGAITASLWWQNARDPKIAGGEVYFST